MAALFWLPGGVKERPILRDDAVEEIEAGKAAGEVWQFPSGDQNELRPGRPEGNQGFDDRRVHNAVMGQCAAIVRGETMYIALPFGLTRPRASRFRSAPAAFGGVMPRFSANLGFLFTDLPFLDPLRRRGEGRVQRRRIHVAL